MTKSLALLVQDMKQLAVELEETGALCWDGGYIVKDDPFLNLTTASEFKYA
jgi:hypothetical protein